jgi:hypothetical protein
LMCKTHCRFVARYLLSSIHKGISVLTVLDNNSELRVIVPNCYIACLMLSLGCCTASIVCWHKMCYQR